LSIRKPNNIDFLAKVCIMIVKTDPKQKLEVP